MLSLLCLPWANRMKIREVVLSPVPTLPRSLPNCAIACPQSAFPRQRDRAWGICPQWLPLPSLCVVPYPGHLHPSLTHNVIHQVTGGSDHKQADQRCKEREPGQCGDLREALWVPGGHNDLYPAPPHTTQTSLPALSPPRKPGSSSFRSSPVLSPQMQTAALALPGLPLLKSPADKRS